MKKTGRISRTTALVKFNPSQRDQRDRMPDNTARPAMNLNLKLKSTSCVDSSPIVNMSAVITIFCRLVRLKFMLPQPVQQDYPEYQNWQRLSGHHLTPLTCWQTL